MDEKTKELIEKTKKIPTRTLLSWAGYTSETEWESNTEESFSRSALIEGNYNDINECYECYKLFIKDERI